MAFDITARKQALAVEDDGVTFHVLDENSEPAFDDDGTTPVTWTVYGDNSKQYARAQAWLNKVNRALRGREQTPDEQSETWAEFVARRSKGFTCFTENGAPLTFSVPTATRILLALPYLRRQAEAEGADHAGFTKASPA